VTSATVVVTTRNRKDDLRVCLASVQRQSVPVETIVIDDASTDGTAEMVRDEFPNARFVSHREMQGYIRGRNEAARLATGDVIVSLDDDAAFSAERICRRHVGVLRR
jgi:glycosyltransferase involved in cell wall biosynthesis